MQSNEIASNPEKKVKNRTKIIASCETNVERKKRPQMNETKGLSQNSTINAALKKIKI